MITEWVVNDHYTLEYNPKWRGEKPSVTKVIVSVLKEPSTQDAKFQTGELDLLDLENLDSLIVDQVYKTAYADRIVDAPVAGLVFLILNENNEYLKDVRVRKAIGMAIDVDKIIAGVYNGNASREYGIIPGGVQGHNDQAKRFAPGSCWLKQATPTGRSTLSWRWIPVSIPACKPYMTPSMTI